MNSSNVALALQILIDLTTQGLKLQQILQQAQAEGRDITAAELDLASQSTNDAIARLKAAINS